MTRFPDYAAVPATVAFHRGIYEEHLEEIAFLYEQRLSRLWSREHPWSELASTEERLDAHIDALAAGGPLAMELCTQAATGEPGLLFASVCAFCRGRQASFLGNTLASIDLEAAELRSALTDALKYSMPDDWRDFSVRAAVAGAPKLLITLAHLLGHRRWGADDILIHRFKDAEPSVRPALLWSLGRTGGRAAIPIVRSLLAAEDSATAAAAYHAALRLEDPDAFNQLVARGARQGASVIALGLAGGRAMAGVLLQSLSDGNGSPESITAVALLGDLSAVRALVRLLSVDEGSAAAAEALYVITGAPLFEEVATSDPISEDEMLPEELAIYRQTGEVPRRADGQPFATTERRLARDPAVWEEWLGVHAAEFVAGRRYRLGKLCTPGVLLDCLRVETFPKAYRPWVAEELQIRHRIGLPFEVDMVVAQQRRVLEEAYTRIDEMSDQFEPGQWYFAGRPVA